MVSSIMNLTQRKVLSGVRVFGSEYAATAQRTLSTRPQPIVPRLRVLTYFRSHLPLIKNRNPCINRSSRLCIHSEHRPPREPLPEDEGKPKLKKKRCALWVGYIGTGYYGSQINRDLPGGETIEGVLERAIYNAGGILDTNYGSMARIGWSRSSRTDKGVSSLALVCGLKMEVPEGTFEGPALGHEAPRAPEIAAKINDHLPSHIQVFDCVKVTKSFNARHACCARTYEYYIPAHILGIAPDWRDSDSPPAALERLKQALALYRGTHPFHNFTARKRYAPAAKKKDKQRARDKGLWVRDKAAPAHPDAEELSPEAPEAEREAPAESGSDGELSDGEMSEQSSREEWDGEHRFSREEFYWKDEVDKDDMVGQSHFRSMLECDCGDIEVVEGPDGARVEMVAVRLKGSSFMIHQIRHMIGGAVAVARGVMALEFLRCALGRPARIQLPRAPPHTLVLVHADFYPVRTPPGTSRPADLPRAMWLSEEGAATKARFRRDMLLPAMYPALTHEDWEGFDKDILPVFAPTEEEHHTLITKTKEWEAAVIEVRKLKLAEEAARAAQAGKQEDPVAKA